ncbi:hypothetical protein LPJ61_002989 [Coemansia biformis]|uniref:WLM domain-containing protein n=1 Tax=Coemansia biformis TaxID=1286918 RepID=A0A9W7YCZ2_9FUNG|nr:hypothetical protein LPJ61_002989 [Coemansia biformis]
MTTANDLVGAIHALKRRPDPDSALRLLQRIGAQVLPIMRQRGWRVKVLREFYPRTPNLLGLNVNQGAEIRLRLRCPHNDAQFLPYGDLLGTMLHELVHIVRAPHDATFYRLLDTLKAEAEALMARGYTGDGFFSGGQRLGAGCSHNVPRHQQRDKAVLAIEERRRQASLAGPPRTLAGPAGWLALQAHRTPGQMAAMALERRLSDERWCGQTMAGAAAATQPDSDDDVVPAAIADSTGNTGPIVISDSDSEAGDLHRDAACVIDDDSDSGDLQQPSASRVSSPAFSHR